MTGVNDVVRSPGSVNWRTVRISGNDWKPYSDMKRGNCLVYSRMGYASVPDVPIVHVADLF